MKLCCGLLEGVPWFWFATANKPVVGGDGFMGFTQM